MSERQATVLFVDLSGSAELYAALGEAAALEAIESCVGMASQATAAAGGRVLKRLGQGLMAIFATPDAAATAAAETQGRVDAAPAPMSPTKATASSCFGERSWCWASTAGSPSASRAQRRPT